MDCEILLKLLIIHKVAYFSCESKIPDYKLPIAHVRITVSEKEEALHNFGKSLEHMSVKTQGEARKLVFSAQFLRGLSISSLRAAETRRAFGRTLRVRSTSF